MVNDNYVCPISDQTHGEEIFNSITHGIGIAFSIAALVLMIVFSTIYGTTCHIVSCSIYGFSLFFLYLMSTLYHSFRDIKVKRVFRILDHVAIYLLIAGSYTPYMLISLKGTWGWTIFSIVWALAIIGIASKPFLVGKYEVLSTIMYVLMGWVAMVAFVPLINSLSWSGFAWLLGGGLAYTLGSVFFLWDRLPFNHGIWHLFVLAGSVLHFLGIMFYVVL